MNPSTSGGNGERAIKLPKKARVKNKAPASVQITAEQLLREAKERDLEILPPPPKQKITDPEELRQYQLKRRKEFEDNIRKSRTTVSNWIKYAKWEESQSETQRARSIFERALDVDHRNISIWLQYAEMEMRNRQVNHARNIWDRAITFLPRASQFWYKFTYMEEMLENIAGARQVFERWMETEPDEQAWHTYINFEMRYKEIERARAIYIRFVHCHRAVKNWIKYAHFEEKHANIVAARQVYERAIEYFGEDQMDEKLILAFARFEENQKEHDRARVIYQYALEHLPKDRSSGIYKAFTVHQKKFGDRIAVENVIISKRRHQYEQQVKDDCFNYDAWFAYLCLLEQEGDVAAIRETYERAIANTPLEQEKRYWRRYVYLWIYYAVYEELCTKDLDRAREVYKTCLDLVIPHKKFTFSKVWLMFAQFEIRQLNLQMARKILGTSIGKCPTNKLFRGYIDMELQLREFERCRKLYSKFLEFSPENCTNWIKFAEMEEILQEEERARAIFELAIKQPHLDMPEVLWKAYIDFEVRVDEFHLARQLYRKLLKRTQHVKVWLSLARFELEHGGGVQASRSVYRKANKALADVSQEREERILLLEAWKQFEAEHGDSSTQDAVSKEMPKRIKKRRQLLAEDGSEAGWEEYFDYIFPADEASQANLKLLEMAKKWKVQKVGDEGCVDIPAPPNTDREGRVREGDSDTDISDSSSAEDM